MPILWTNQADPLDPTTVVAIDPKLAAVAAVTQAAILLDVYAYLAPVRWGSKLDMAAKYLAAHTGALVLRGGGLGGAGPITGQALGPASTQFAQPTITDALTDLDATPWGRRYRMLVTSLGVFAVG